MSADKIIYTTFIRHISWSCLIAEGRESNRQGFPLSLFLKHLPWKRFCGSLASIAAILKPIPEEQPVISTTFCPGLAMATPLGSRSGCHLTAKLRDNKRIREKGRVTWVTCATRLLNILVLAVPYFTLRQNYRVCHKLNSKYYLFS